MGAEQRGTVVALTSVGLVWKRAAEPMEKPRRRGHERQRQEEIEV